MKTQLNEKLSFIKMISNGFMILTFFLMPLAKVTAQEMRGVRVRVKGSNGQTTEVKLYDGSFALVIGESNYTAGWDSLEGVKTDVAGVKRVLEQGGFNVEAELNLDSDEQFNIDK
jgi:hypothetical protein